MTIRAKLYVAILLTVLGPVITIAVALHGMQRLGDRFDEVQERADHRALALDLKFDVTDFNGWQTAYGYDDGASRPRFERSVRQFRADLNAARNELTDPREERILREIGTCALCLFRAERLRELPKLHWQSSADRRYHRTDRHHARAPAPLRKHCQEDPLKIGPTFPDHGGAEANNLRTIQNPSGWSALSLRQNQGRPPQMRGPVRPELS